MANEVKVKQKKYKYEKENKADPRICKVCGKAPKEGLYGLVGGICLECINKSNATEGELKGFIWDTSKQALIKDK